MERSQPGRMPAIFIGHGSPMNALDENPYTAVWRQLGAKLPRPRAILAISAHWTTRGTSVTAMPSPPTIHDFGGFPQALFDIRYPAPGDPALAARVQALLAPLPVRLDQDWGLDHGVWSVLLKVYPEADVPVLQLSLDLTQPASYHYELGARLAPLRDEGVLLFATGNVVHNLRRMNFDAAAPAPIWARDFNHKVRASVLGKNVKFYKVVNGLRSNPIGPELAVSLGEWHTLTVECEGTQIRIWYDDKLAMPSLGDNSFSEGQLGFRTMADAVCYFTDASVDYTPIIPAAQTMVDSIVEKEPRILGLRIYTLQTNGIANVIASKDATEIGMAGTDAELKAISDGAVSFGREKGEVLVTLPLHDRNGDYIAAVRVRLKSFFGETQDTAITRARMIVKQMQSQVGSEKDLF